MHDLDRSDLVFEADGMDAGVEDSAEYAPGASDEVFDDAEQAELAGELLSVSTDDELDRFLGGLIKRGRKALSTATGRKLGGLLKGAVKKSLPSLASMAGAAIGGPAGARIAGGLAPHLSSLLGLELEGLSPEDQEFEAAKQLVRLAGAAIDNAAGAEPGTPPDAAARQAMIDAARSHAPGLLRTPAASAPRATAQRGTWIRRGNKIVLLGV